MLYKILADIVVLIHFLWIVFLVFGTAYRPNPLIHAPEQFGLNG